MNVALRRTLAQRIYVAHRTGVTASGQPQYGAAEAVACRVENSVRMIRLYSGSDITTHHRVFTEVPLSEDDRVWLPGTDHTNASLAREIRRVDACVDLAGRVSHYETFI